MDQNFWMNPRRSMGATWQGGAGLLGERVPTRETLPATPPGTTDEFINGRWVPRDGFQYDIEVDGNTEGFNFDNQLTPHGMEAFRRRQGITADPLMIPNPLQNRFSGQRGEVPQTQRPAKPTREFPWGQSIADSFMGGLRKMDDSPFWKEGGSPSESWQQLKNALTGQRDPEVGRQFNQGPAMLPSFPVF